MRYAILCYHSEAVTNAWSREHDDAVMEKIQTVKKSLGTKVGPSVRLVPTTAAVTLNKKSEPPVVLDGPFAETKEQLLGFYVVDADDLDDAIEIAKALGNVNPGGSYEIRPIQYFDPKGGFA